MLIVALIRLRLWSLLWLDVDVSSVSVFTVIWWRSQKVFPLLFWMLNLLIFLGTGKERIFKVQCIVMVSIVLKVMMLLLVVFMRGLQKYRDWDFNFFHDWIGMGNFLFDEFLDRVGNFDFFYLHHWVRSWHFDFFNNGIGNLLGNKKKSIRTCKKKQGKKDFQAFEKAFEACEIKNSKELSNRCKSMKYPLLHNFLYWIGNSFFNNFFNSDWIGLRDMHLDGC